MAITETTFNDPLTVSLEQVRIATPCPARWEDMDGSDVVRFCGACEKNVYNLSGMTADEAAEVIHRATGERVCGRLYRRADGTVLTADCPVGIARVRQRARAIAARIAAALALAAGGLAAGILGTRDEPRGQTIAELPVVRSIKRLIEPEPPGAWIAGEMVMPTPGSNGAAGGAAVEGGGAPGPGMAGCDRPVAPAGG